MKILKGDILKERKTENIEAKKGNERKKQTVKEVNCEK